MGCCYSLEKPTVYEVVLDENGVAQRVRTGQGTHLIHVSKDKETHMEKKITLPSSISSLTCPEAAYKPPTAMTWTAPSLTTKKIHPVNLNTEKTEVS
ncbi:hypothetical protein CLU79DRAFT_746008 [Phycomyces nitens]|nr:hypothetical protein CLU79DRAFT_746008 [Phycomyces nitens]